MPIFRRGSQIIPSKWDSNYRNLSTEEAPQSKIPDFTKYNMMKSLEAQIDKQFEKLAGSPSAQFAPSSI